MPQDLTKLASILPADVDAQTLRAKAPGLYAAVDNFWQGLTSNDALSPRIRELVLLAVHASSSSLNQDLIERHVTRALAAGASELDILDVVTTIIPLANHPLYIGIPALLDELEQAGDSEGAVLPEMRPDVQAIKDNFVSNRGYWTPMRDTIGKLMPDYFTAFIGACMEPWQSGSLTPAERELMYIAIDCTITHTYEPGIRMHLKNALRYGATREQILAVYGLCASMGIEGYVAVARQLAARG